LIPVPVNVVLNLGVEDINGLQSALDGKVANPVTQVTNGIGYWDGTKFETISGVTVNPSVLRITAPQIFATSVFYGTNFQNPTNNANSTLFLSDNGTVITRNVADANPALIVNQANASSTGDILRLQKAGSSVVTFYGNGNILTNGVGYFGGIANTDPLNAYVKLLSSGVVIERNKTTGDALVVNQQQGTGDIQKWQFGGSTLSRVDKDGNIIAPAFFATNTAYFLKPSSTTTSLTVAGNVGIANTNPQEKLDVTGNIKASGSITSASATVNGTIVASGEITAPSIKLGSWRIIADESSATLNFTVV
jgi:hypothetical protein